ncbi:MAG: hypothetical protein NT070_04555 [Cyanobacteria bacterium]|nr:hypothetical protein [Cyanobacteriota bacterium]
MAYGLAPIAPPPLTKSLDRRSPLTTHALKTEVSRSKEGFICHLQNTYDEDLPPIWAMV